MNIGVGEVEVELACSFSMRVIALWNMTEWQSDKEYFFFFDDDEDVLFNEDDNDDDDLLDNDKMELNSLQSEYLKLVLKPCLTGGSPVLYVRLAIRMISNK